MTRFTDIDLARLPRLPLGQEDYETILSERIAELTGRLGAAGIDYDVGALETDPLVITEEAGAYRELLAHTRRDDAVRSVLLATTWGPYLDAWGAGQVPPVARKVLVPADPLTGAEAVMEADEDFRRRIQLAPEALSTAGPEGAYVFFATSVPGVKAAAAYGPMSFGGTPEAPFTPLGHVHVPIVAAAGTGAAPADLVVAAQLALAPDERRPIAEWVTVSPAIIVPYAIVATLWVGAGADRGIVKAEAEARLARQAARQHRPGAAALRQQFYGAAYVAGADGVNLVERVDLVQPAADINAEAITPANPGPAYRAPYCTAISVTVEVAP